MRIIGGKFKGKNIFFLKSGVTRPLKDSVKESIFNVLIHSNLLNINLNEANVLDLYSGIGSFGLECMSRGASSVTFVERDRSAVEVLNNNLLSLSLKDKSIVIENDISSFISKGTSKKFEIIFLDPPFIDNNYIDDLKLIYKNRIYRNRHVIIIHRERKSAEDFGKNINSLIVKNYGRSKIIFAKFLD